MESNLSAFAAYKKTPTKCNEEAPKKKSRTNVSVGNGNGSKEKILELSEPDRTPIKKLVVNIKKLRSKELKISSSQATKLKKKKSKIANGHEGEANLSVLNENIDYAQNFDGNSNQPSASTPSRCNVNGAELSGKVHERKRTAKLITEKNTNRPNEAKNLSIEKIAQSKGSVIAGKHMFAWIVSPTESDRFMSTYWERCPLFINRNARDYYQHIVSTTAIDEMLRNNMVEYTKNIDITSYVDGVRQTFNPEGRALSAAVWDFYRTGCSIRLLNPQTFIPNIHKLNATLQEYFHCMTGANIYLTPPNSQGFAPHYDDIEAFVLQIEGKKKWRLYAPRNENEVLARVSSGNFTQQDIGEPVLEKTLEAGDLLYFPRGMIHQAETVPDCHSLHITLSLYQKTSFGDLLEILLPDALKKAIDSNVAFRRGLPLNIWNNLGIINSDTQGEPRNQIIGQIKQLFSKIIEYADFDDAVDQMAINYQHDALPPVLTAVEKCLTVFGTESNVNVNGTIDEIKITEDVKFRLLRANAVRLVAHEDAYRLYFHVDNSKEYHEFDLNFIELDGDAAPAIEYLIKAYPEYSSINEMPLEMEDSLAIAKELWSRGLLMTQSPLNIS